MFVVRLGYRQGKGSVETFFLRGRGNRRMSSTSGSELDRQTPILNGIQTGLQQHLQPQELALPVLHEPLWHT